jgi:hypothetical protein
MASELAASPAKAPAPSQRLESLSANQDGCAGQRACTVQVAELAVGDGEIGFQMTGE